MPSRCYSSEDLILLQKNVSLPNPVTEQLKFLDLFMNHNLTSRSTSSQKLTEKRPALRYSITELLLLRGKSYTCTCIHLSGHVKKLLKKYNLFRYFKPSLRIPCQTVNPVTEANKKQLTLTYTSKVTNYKYQKLEDVDQKSIESAYIDLKCFDAVNKEFTEESPVLSFTQGRSRRFVVPSREEMIAFIPDAALCASPAPRSRISGASGAPRTASAEVTASAASETGHGLAADSCGGSYSTPGEACVEPCFDSPPVIVESPLHDLHERLLANCNNSCGWVRISNLDESLVQWIVKVFPSKSMESSEDDMCLTFWSLLDSYGDATEIISSHPRSIDIKYRSKDSCIWAHESLDGQYLFSNDAIECYTLDK